MNRFHSCVLLAMLFTSSASYAFLPPITPPLAERVKISSHIFVGEVRDAYFIDPSGRKISPRQAAQQLDQALVLHRFWVLPVIETKLRVKESLLWRKVKPQEIILLRSEVPAIGHYQRKERANGLARMLAMDKQEVGKKFVFFTNTVSQPGRRRFFIYSGGPWSYGREEMREKEAIQKAVKRWKVIKRELSKCCNQLHHNRLLEEPLAKNARGSFVEAKRTQSVSDGLA